MAKNRIDVFFIRVMAASILFAVYALICKVVNIDDKEVSSGVGLLCCIAAIVTPIYHNITIKRLGLDYERMFDYYVDQTVGFLFVDFLAFMYYALTSNDNRTFYYDNTPIEKFVMYFFLYIAGIWVWALGSYLIHVIKNKMYGDMLKRVLSAVIGFPLYFLAALVPILSWVERISEWIPIDYVAEVVVYLFFAFVTGGVTGIFHFISGRIIKVSSEKMQDHVIFSCFFAIAAVLCAALNYNIGVIRRDDAIGLILILSVKGLFMYIVGNLVYFIWCNEKKRRKRRIDGGYNEEESKGIDEDLNEDEHGIGKVSSEIILIPGIDEDMGEGKNGSVSAGDSGDC